MPAKNRRLLLKTAAGNPLFQPISAESTEFTPDSGITSGAVPASAARTVSTICFIHAGRLAVRGAPLETRSYLKT